MRWVGILWIGLAGCSEEGAHDCTVPCHEGFVRNADTCECESACPSGYEWVDGHCVEVGGTDSETACEVLACELDEDCAGLAMGLPRCCGGCCVDVSANDDNCGDCASACDGPCTDGAELCSAASCVCP